MTEFENRCQQLNLDAVILGYADDHVICVKNRLDIQTVLCLFNDVCLDYGMVLEMSKTEYVCPSALHKSEPLSFQFGGSTLEMKSKQKVKWLGFQLDFSSGFLQLNVSSLMKLYMYVTTH